MRRVLPFAIALVIILATWIQTSAQGESKEWLTDMERAMQQAAAENKDLLLDFTGSDWCGWCIRLNEEVFSKPEFEQVKDHFILVELDFPADASKVSAETREQNEAWQQKLGVEGFPTIFLTDAQGRPYATTGYREGGVEPYVEHLAELRKVREIRDQAFAAAKEAQGTEKAKLLHEGLAAMRGSDFVLPAYRDEVEQIIALDAGNEAGLQEQYQTMLAEADARQKMQEVQQRVYAAMAEGEQGAGEAVKLLETEFADAKDNPALERQLRLLQVQLLPAAGEFDKAIAVVDQLLADDRTAEDEKLNLGVQKAYLLVQAGRTDEAVKQFDHLVAELENPEMKAQLLFAKGQILQSTGNHDQALAAYAQLVELSEEGTPIWIYGQQYRGDVLQELGRAKEALTVFDELLAVEGLEMPMRVGMLARKASAQLAAGDREAAVATARKAKELITALEQEEVTEFWLDEAQQRVDAVLGEGQQP